MIFKLVSQAEAIAIGDNMGATYSPGYDNSNIYYYYDGTTTPQIGYVNLTLNQMLGLTPINPTKPMFPKKK